MELLVLRSTLEPKDNFKTFKVNVIYIKRELVEDINLNSIIDEFYYTKHQRVQLR